MYRPLKITGPTSGLVQERQNFLLPDDAYPVLQNAYVWREKLKRKKGYQLLGRLQRAFSGVAGVSDGSNNFTGNLFSIFGLETATASLVPGSFSANIGGRIYTEPVPPDGTLLRTGVANGSTINWATGDISLINGGIGPGTPVSVFFDYYPGLPVMGIRLRELNGTSINETIFFDQKYAYKYNNTALAFQEFIPGTTWNARNAPVTSVDFFWSTNYWVSSTTIPTTVTAFFSTSNVKLMWVTNNTGAANGSLDPIRITDGVTWVDFSPPNFGQIDATNYLVQCLALLPFRGRMLAFNTYEGPNAAGGINYSNRIRWSTIGNPFIPYAAGPPAVGSWRDDIRGQGGFLDIPTSEDIVAVGFVRDNLVIYCERSTWQLRYTGRSIAPFQIEKVNSELGAEGTFSAIQFDTSLLCIGDKGVVECDSYKSQRIDVKIPDLVFSFQTQNDGRQRVHGVRDFINRLAYWTYPKQSETTIFPTQRLVYNYENDSWATFNDSLTTLGTYQPQTSPTWLDIKKPWIELEFSWLDQVESIPAIVGGNQQGFVEFLDQLSTNDVSLYISDITANTTTPTVITSPNHNMLTGFVIEISGIPAGAAFATTLNSPKVGLISAITQTNPVQVTSTFHNLSTGDMINITGVVGMTELNTRDFTVTVIDANTFTIDVDSTTYGAYVSGGTWTGLSPNAFGIDVIDADSFALYKYNPITMQFSDGQLDVPSTPYVGGGLINIRENFYITSKKFNFLDEGQGIQLGWIDILMEASEASHPGAISLYVYLDYNDNLVSNTTPENDINDGNLIGNPDTFFNSVIPTTQSDLQTVGGTKFWQRVYCSTNANFITLQYTFSNAQMAGTEQELEVQIDAQVLWIRHGGRMTQG